jgi:hypothetical protein
MRGEKDREGDAFSPDFRGEIGIDSHSTPKSVVTE